MRARVFLAFARRCGLVASETVADGVAVTRLTPWGVRLGRLLGVLPQQVRWQLS